MPSSRSTDPTSLAPETLPPSDGTPAAGEDIGLSQEVVALVNALKDDRFDDAQEKAAQLAREIDAVLRYPRPSADSTLTGNPAENRGAGDDSASATIQDYAASLAELQQRFDALVFEHSETRRERDELARQLGSATSGSADPGPQNPEMERSLHSIRQARDNVLGRNVALGEKLTAAEERIAELEYDLERAERARDAALTLSRDLSETSDELRQKSLELTCERDQLREQVASLTKASGDRCARESSGTSNDANCKAAQDSTAKPLNSSDTSVAPAAMQACLERLAIDAGNRETLDELEDHFHSFGERARAQDSVALDRLSAGCEHLTGWLKKTPGRIAENIGPLANAVELLGRIAAIDEPDRITDTADALVYSLDADVDNCECITMAMERIALKGRYATKPKVAVNDLTAGPCDLIILDLDVPDMNGFEFFALVRALPHHEKTPVIFLSEVMETEARAAQLEDNAHVFVPKPYNLNTLELIALSMILKARLAALEEGPVQSRGPRRRPRVKA